MSVLVIGGTGTTGSRVVAGLRAEGASVLVGTRSPREPGHVRFDWHDPTTHTTAGVDAVYLVAPIGVAEPGELVRGFLEAADVRRAVLLSSSAVPDSASGMGALAPIVRESVPEWAVLRPSWFMQNFVGDHPVADGIRERGEIVTATGDGRVAFVDAADIAAVAVRALLDPSPHNTDHTVTGPEALTYADAAAIISEATGNPVRHVRISTSAMADRFTATGMPADFAAMLAGLDEDISRGTQERTTNAVEEITGHPARSFAEFIKAHLQNRSLRACDIRSRSCH